MCRSIPCIILHNNIFSFSQIFFFLKLQRMWSVFLLYYDYFAPSCTSQSIGFFVQTHVPLNSMHHSSQYLSFQFHQYFLSYNKSKAFLFYISTILYMAAPLRVYPPILFKPFLLMCHSIPCIIPHNIFSIWQILLKLQQRWSVFAL